MKRTALALFLPMLLLACGDDEPLGPPVSTTGAIIVTTSTKGTATPPSNYTVVVDGGASQVVDANGSVTFSDLSPASHTVELTGVPAHCTVSSANPATVTVTAGASTPVAMTVQCLVGDLKVTTVTTGEDLDAGYVVWIDDAITWPMNANDMVITFDLPVGQHIVELRDVAANCAVIDNPQTVFLVARDTAEVLFNLACSQLTGAIEVVASPIGPTFDPDGYTVEVDGTLSQVIDASGSAKFSGLAVGDHDVELTDVALKCPVISQNPQTVTVTANDTTLVVLDILCGYLAYAANSNSNTVSVIATATNTVVATIDVASNPIGVAITPDGEFTYVSNFDPNTVSVIATATNTVVATVPVGTNPSGVAITPDGEFVYVANSLIPGTVSVIEAATNVVMATADVSGYPNRVAITPDGAFAYVTLNNTGSVAVVETTTNTEVATVDVGSEPHGVAITPDGEFGYVSNFNSNTVSAIATASNTVVATIDVGSNPQGVAITPDGAHAYVANQTKQSTPSTVSIIEIASNTVVATVGVDIFPQGVAITPDGALAYVTNAGSVNVNSGFAPTSVIETTTRMTVDAVSVGAGTVGVAITPF